MTVSDQGGGDFEQCPTGSHVARCTRIIDLGTQASEYLGKPNIRRQILVSWELPDTLMTEGEQEGMPFMMSKFYTASLGEKATLRKDLVNWRGKDFTKEELAGFNIEKLLTMGCLLSVTSGVTTTGKEKSVISGIMALPKGMPLPEQVTKTIYFSLDKFDQFTFERLSNGIKKMIEASPEYRFVTANKQQSTTHTDRDVPPDTDEVDPWVD